MAAPPSIAFSPGALSPSPAPLGAGVRAERSTAAARLLAASASVARFLLALLIALGIFGIFLALSSANPFSAYATIAVDTLGSTYSLSEVVVRAIPLILCALAVVVPAQVGLVNVGGEGQLYMGAWSATWVALTFGTLPGPVLIPAMLVAGFLGGGVWGGITGFLRASVGLNETIATLMLNYVAIRVIDLFVYGPWRDKGGFNWPYTAQFTDAARLPTFFGTRIHLGIVFALVAVVLVALLLRRTRWGFDMRVIGGNDEAARRGGLAISRYIVIAMIVGGGIAGVAGMAQVSGIELRLRPDFSSSFGYVGFLASWLGEHDPWRVTFMAVLLAVIAVGGDQMQIAVHLPSSTISILTALFLFAVLATRRLRLWEGTAA